MNHYPHHIGDYAKDTAHLSLTQHGAYRQMMDMYYRTERPLPADRTRLHILLRCQSKLDRVSVDTVLEEFFQLRDDGWHHKRCNEGKQERQQGYRDEKQWWNRWCHDCFRREAQDAQQESRRGLRTLDRALSRDYCAIRALALSRR